MADANGNGKINVRELVRDLMLGGTLVSVLTMFFWAGHKLGCIETCLIAQKEFNIQIKVDQTTTSEDVKVLKEFMVAKTQKPFGQWGKEDLAKSNEEKTMAERIKMP